MNIEFRSYREEEIDVLMDIWNEILVEGIAFPDDPEGGVYDKEGFIELLDRQSAVSCILVDGKIVGLYILHPNNIGRCGHIANASYAISKNFRGKKLGKPLVEYSLKEAKELGFKGIQFNAVVVDNKPAIHIYKDLGFDIIGRIPEGFRLKSGKFSDTYIMYRSLDDI